MGLQNALRVSKHFKLPQMYQKKQFFSAFKKTNTPSMSCTVTRDYHIKAVLSACHLHTVVCLKYFTIFFSYSKTNKKLHILFQAAGNVASSSGAMGTVRGVLMDGQQLKLVTGKHVLARLLRPAQQPP